MPYKGQGQGDANMKKNRKEERVKFSEDLDRMKLEAMKVEQAHQHQENKIAELEEPSAGDEKGRLSSLQKQLRKTKFCMYHLQGVCQFGDSCAFAHSCEELQEAPDLQKTRLCPVESSEGVCEDPKCSFAHGEQELRSTDLFYKKALCMWYEKGRCRNGDRCRFAHGNYELGTAGPLGKEISRGVAGGSHRDGFAVGKKKGFATGIGGYDHSVYPGFDQSAYLEPFHLGGCGSVVHEPARNHLPAEQSRMPMMPPYQPEQPPVIPMRPLVGHATLEPMFVQTHLDQTKLDFAAAQEQLSRGIIPHNLQPPSAAIQQENLELLRVYQRQMQELISASAVAAERAAGGDAADQGLSLTRFNLHSHLAYLSENIGVLSDQVNRCEMQMQTRTRGDPQMLRQASVLNSVLAVPEGQVGPRPMGLNSVPRRNPRQTGLGVVHT